VAETPVSRRVSLRDALLNQLTVEVAEERRSRVSKPPTN
jgi:hypothetical protein